MKRAALIALAIVVTLGLTACVGSKDETKPIVGGGSSSAGKTAPDYSKLVTPADVEKVTGFKGIKIVPADPTNGAGGDLNFAQANGELVMMANFGDKAWFEANKKTPNYRGPVSGIGDAAFNGPTAQMGTKIFQLGFVKGDTGVLLTSFLSNDGGKPIIPQAKLEEIAKLVLPRMQ